MPGLILRVRPSGACSFTLETTVRGRRRYATLGSPDCPFLFPARPPTPPIDNIGCQWDRIRSEAGLPGLRLHDLRHNWASVAAMNGVDMVTVAKLLGHRHHRTTEGYAHLSDGHLVKAASPGHADQEVTVEVL